MRFRKQFFMLSALFVAFMGVPAMAAVEVGQAAPDFEAVDATGQAFKLSEHKGNIVVLEWTNHECPFVKKHYVSGNMQAVQKQALALGGVKWVSIVSSAPGRQGHVNAEEAMQIVSDVEASPSFKILDESGDVGRLYGAMTTPHMFVVDEGGRLVYAGAIDDRSSPHLSTVEGAMNYVLAALAALKAGAEVEISQTRPYGCAVKY